MEAQWERAKKRLLAAQDEKTAAQAEFLQARAALKDNPKGIELNISGPGGGAAWMAWSCILELALIGLDYLADSASAPGDADFNPP